MSRLSISLVVLLVALLASSVAGAQHFEDDEEDEDAPSAFVEWLQDGNNRAWIGLNGILTSPADPVMFALEGDDVFESLPAAAYTGRVVGFFAGVFQMPYRVLMGTFDTVFALTPKLYMQSPSPRFKLFPWITHDNE